MEKFLNERLNKEEISEQRNRRKIRNTNEGNNMLTKDVIAEMLLNIDAVSISLTHPFKYASGLRSPIYTNCRLLSSHPKERDAIIEKMMDEISGLKDKIDVVISSGASSIFIATLLAQHLKLPMAY